MVKKFVFHMNQNSYDVSDTASLETKRLIDINNEVHGMLVAQKDKITAYHRTKRWDNYKKLTNDYELVFTTHQGFPSIAKYTPISRSYFKLWEIMVDLQEELGLCRTTFETAAFLADAPGGFVEAWVNFSEHFGLNQSKIYAISLKSSHNVVPTWKLDEWFCRKHNVHLVYGANNNGDLYDMRTIDSFVATVGESACGFVTGDGGFDFSSDFNNQEDMSLTLLMSEIYTALRIQKPNGVFVLKIYDIHKVETMQLLYMLYTLYNNVYITKPLSSRPANSEKYVVASGFTHDAFKRDTCLRTLERLIKGTGTFDNVVPDTFLHMIVEFNCFYIANQIMHICKTLAYDNNDTTKQKTIRRQLNKAIKWCHKYKIAINPKALLCYKRFY
jgi:23S rRNA U2552 (ribose-2'-O)-methylase RlmE/FtsJ